MGGSLADNIPSQHFEELSIMEGDSLQPHNSMLPVVPFWPIVVYADLKWIGLPLNISLLQLRGYDELLIAKVLGGGCW